MIISLISLLMLAGICIMQMNTIRNLQKEVNEGRTQFKELKHRYNLCKKCENKLI